MKRELQGCRIKERIEEGDWGFVHFSKIKSFKIFNIIVNPFPPSWWNKTRRKQGSGIFNLTSSNVIPIKKECAKKVSWTLSNYSKVSEIARKSRGKWTRVWPCKSTGTLAMEIPGQLSGLVEIGSLEAFRGFSKLPAETFVPVPYEHPRKVTPRCVYR